MEYKIFLLVLFEGLIKWASLNYDSIFIFDVKNHLLLIWLHKSDHQNN